MVSALQPGQQRGLGHCGLSLALGPGFLYACDTVTPAGRILKYKTLGKNESCFNFCVSQCNASASSVHPLCTVLSVVLSQGDFDLSDALGGDDASKPCK